MAYRGEFAGSNSPDRLSFRIVFSKVSDGLSKVSDGLRAFRRTAMS